MFFSGSDAQRFGETGLSDQQEMEATDLRYDRELRIDDSGLLKGKNTRWHLVTKADRSKLAFQKNLK